MHIKGETGSYNIAKVIMAYDLYSDVWEDYFNLMQKFWPDINMPIYFVDLEKDCPYQELVTIKCGNQMKWTARLKYALKQITCKYIYLSVEDFFYCKKVENERFEEAVRCMEKNQIVYYRLISYPHLMKNYCGIRGLKCIDKKMESGISLQPAIWNREYLLTMLGEDDCNAWEFEYKQNMKSRNSYPGIIKNCVVDSTKIISYRNEIIKGKHNLFSLLYFKIKGYKINTQGREIMSVWDTICYYLRFYGYRIMPDKLKNKSRIFLRKIGVSFVEDKYVNSHE